MKRASSLRATEWPSPLTSVAISAPLLHGLGRALHGLDDVLVAGAAADVPRQRPTNLFLAGVGILGEQRARREHHPGRAKPSLEAVLLVERGLHRMQLRALREPLDRRHLPAVGLHGEHGARLHGNAVEQNRAGPAAGR